jgi:histidinol phosphatase-like PHP family hydrolase
MQSVLNKIAKERIGAELYKIDLHFHTPSSKDQKYLNSTNNVNYHIPKNKDTLQALNGKEFKDAVKRTADVFVKFFKEKKLDLVAITDHNTPSFIDNEDWKRGTWYKALREAVDRDPECNTKVLPGMEITTARTHILAIFNDYYKEGVEDLLIQFTIANILKEIGFKANDVGEYVSETGGVSVYNAVNLIIENGGIPIVAHVDGPGRSFRQSDFKWKRGKEVKFAYKGELEAITRIPELAVMEYVNEKARIIPNDKKKETWMEAIVDLRENVEIEEGGKKEKGVKPAYGFVRNSDCHKFKDIAHRHSFVKMDGLDFKSFFYSCREPENRLWSDVNYQNVTVPDHQIEGMVVEKGFINNAAHRFNPYTNCILGNVSSGKSTRIHLMAQALGIDPAEFSNTGGETKKVYTTVKVKKNKYLIEYTLKTMKHRYMEVKDGAVWKDAKPATLQNFDPLFINCGQVKEDAKKSLGNDYKKELIDECFKKIKKLVSNHPEGQPLVIDEPELCLNDEVIEQKLIPLLKEKRMKNQMIITTSKSNIPIILDAENIIIVNKGKTVLAGALEYKDIVPKLHQITEGGAEVYKEKHRRYHHVLDYQKRE